MIKVKFIFDFFGLSKTFSHICITKEFGTEIAVFFNFSNTTTIYYKKYMKRKAT